MRFLKMFHHSKFCGRNVAHVAFENWKLIKIKSLSQPLNFFNEMKWDRQLQSVQVQYNTLEYQKVQIDIKKKSVVAFFEMLEIQNEKIINSKGLAVANTYRKVLKKLVESSRTMAYDSIDIELKFLDLQKRARFLAKAELLKAGFCRICQNQI
jgi:hypothetical protein